MAKKKHKKKHSFQHKNAPAAATTPMTTHSKSAPAVKPATMPNEWGEVRADVRKTLFLGTIFIVLMLGIWVLLDATSLGSNVYNFIKL